MRIERLQRLITILEAVPDEHYNQAVWTCGSASCAGGWAAQDESFKSEGLTLVRKIPEYGGQEGLDALALFFNLSASATYYIFGSIAYESLARKLVDEAGFDPYELPDYEIFTRFIRPSHVIARIKEILA